jgi:hypothetical protein
MLPKAVQILAWCLVASLSLIEGAIHEYNGVELPKDALMYHRSGMYGPDDTPEGKGEPAFIKVDLTLARQDPDYHGEKIKVQLAVFDQEVWDNGLGLKVKNKNGELELVHCCTAELVLSGVCEEAMTLILSQDATQGTYIYDIEFTPQEVSNMTGPVRVEARFDVPHKGLRYLLISSCNDMTGTVIISGKTEWRNPYGYLPGDLFGFLSFFSRLAAFYIVIGVIWAIACARHWKKLMLLQNCVVIVLALGMMETALRYYDLAQFNRFGTRGTILMLASSVMHTLKQTVSRLVVLVVSMGFGIVKPSLGDSFNNVVGLGGLFFFSAIIQRIYELSIHTSSEITFMQYVTILRVAVFDLVFFFWIMRSLNDVIGQLEKREQGPKLLLYRRFRLILITTMVLASIWSLIYSFIVIPGKISQDWESRWLFDEFFEFLYLTILVWIMILWRPTDNSTQVAYSKVCHPEVDDDEEEHGSGLEITMLPKSPPNEGTVLS